MYYIIPSDVHDVRVYSAYKSLLRYSVHDIAVTIKYFVYVVASVIYIRNGVTGVSFNRPFSTSDSGRPSVVGIANTGGGRKMK